VVPEKARKGRESVRGAVQRQGEAAGTKKRARDRPDGRRWEI